MNIPDHISESLETIFWVKNTVLKVFDTDPDPGSEPLTMDPGSGMDQFGSKINIPEPQHWLEISTCRH
jgi:hypothetical protein